MSIINNGLLLAAEAAAAGGYQISRSLRFNSADSAYLNRTPASAGNRRTWTFSCWIKRSALGTFQSLFACIASDASHYTQFIFETGDNFVLYDSLCSGGLAFSTTQVFRDTSAWFHFLLYYDTTQSTASAKAKLYINGAEVTQFNADNRSGLTADSSINRADQHVIGSRLPFTGGVGAAYFSGYLADIHFIDGQALTPSSFAETDATTGQWVPKAFSGGSYGTNGFRLTFSDNSGTTSTTLGKDAAGSNNWTPNNFSVASGSGNDSLVDSPTSFGTNTGAGGEVRGNYATWNPLDKNASFNAANGNLDANASAGVNGNIRGTIGVSSGKWYWEYLINNTSPAVGIATAAATLADFPGVDASGYSYTSGGQKWNSNSGSSYGATYTTNDIIGVALDLDAGTLVFYKNGVSQGTAYSGLPVGTYFPAGGRFSGTFDVTLNAGARPFAYTAPSGYKALCTTNLPTPTIADGSTAMDVKLYTGNGNSSRSVSGFNFSPDLVWLKARSFAPSHHLFDTIRGATKFLGSDTTNAEQTGSDRLTAFDSAGFTLGSNAEVNQNGSTYVAWAWDAGSSTVTNTSGSISSQVRANASAGFSVVSWTAPNPPGSITSVGHGLNAAPQFMIFKNRDLNNHWTVYHSSFSNLVRNYLKFSTESIFTRAADLWGTINSSVFSIDQGFLANANEKCIAYCFAPVAGYSSFGSYVGNGSATDGPFVYTGFRPRWILIKSATETAGWMIYDTARDTYNQSITLLYPNLSLAEQSSSNYAYDIVSNGFKVRNSGQNNTSSQTYIYAAFAENPFQYARAR